jgi:hypothetical protein
LGVAFVFSAACGKDETPEPGTSSNGGRGGVVGMAGAATNEGGSGAAPSEGGSGAGVSGEGGSGTGGEGGSRVGGEGGSRAGASGSLAGASGEGGEGGEGGAVSDCSPSKANPSEVRIGELASLELPRGANPYLADATSDVIARLFVDLQGNWELLCRAAGEARLSVYTDCDTAELVVTCVDDRECCPIDATDSATGCVQFGGSPPCYVGCACTGDPNVYESIAEDENGCLMRSLTSVADGEVVPCETPEGEVEEDPREPVNEPARCERRPLGDDLRAGSCQGMAAALRAADPVSLGEGGAGGDSGGGDVPRECDSEGRWRIDFPLRCYPEDACARADPPGSGLELDAPGELIPSADGCDLTFVAEEPWSNSSECGVVGYRIDLRVDGQTANGFIRFAESGFCNGESTTVARATRIR